MNKILVSAAVATLMLSGTGAALAEGAMSTDNAMGADNMSADTPMDFTALDTDASGGLSLAEAQVAWPDLTQEEFEAADMNDDAALSEDEANALKATMGGKPSAVQSGGDSDSDEAGSIN